MVHFDGHGVLPDHRGGTDSGSKTVERARPGMEGLLAFEKPGGGSDQVAASRLAAVLKSTGVPVVVLNACQSGAVGKDLEASIATRLLREGCAAVVAMAYTVYAVAAAEFMAVFYERLFAGDTISAAVTAGRRRLFQHDARPSPKGDLPLADWLVPVHYLHRDVAFPQAQTVNRAAELSLDSLLDDLRAPAPRRDGGVDSLDSVGVFIGRDDLFYHLEVAARVQRVVVLHGPGGTGKTELAKAFGRWWRDTGGTDHPEWVLWHSFEPGVASFGLDGMIAETGLQVFGTDFARLHRAERLQVVERLLAERRLLLIWDNFEALASMPDPADATLPPNESGRREIKDFLARIARNRNCKSTVIITSRTAEDWLGDVRRIKVGGLAREEAAQYAEELLVTYPAAAPRRKRRAFGELLEWLDGHPLSMRVILPYLDVAEPEVLLESLRGTAPLPGGHKVTDEVTSLSSSISYSFSHLAEETQRLLPAVCLFEGVVDARVLATFSKEQDVPRRFANASGHAWKMALDDATRVGLLTGLGSGMYRIHPTLPIFVARWWRAESPQTYKSERDAATRALAATYTTWGRWLEDQVTHGDARSAYAMMEQQRRTLGVLLGYALDHQLWESAQMIAQPLYSYWETRGLGKEADAWADRVQFATEGVNGAAPGLDTPAGALWLFFAVAQANRQMQTLHLDEAERTYRRILDMLQAQPNSRHQRSRIAMAKHNLSANALYRGQLAEAEYWCRESLAIRKELGDLAGIADSNMNLGLIAQHQGRLTEAEQWCRKSLAIRKNLGDLPGMARSYYQLANIAHLQERLTEAEDMHHKSLALRKQLGDRFHVADSYHQLGILAQNQGRMEEAEDWYRETLAIYEDLGNLHGMSASYHQLAMIADDRERLDEAESWCRRSLAISEDLGNLTGVALSYHQLGIIARHRQQPDEAESWHRKSLAICEELGDRAGIATSYGQLGLLAEEQGQPLQALESLVRCVTQFEQFPHPLSGPAPEHLARLTSQLGTHALEASWLRVTSRPLPQAVRDYIITSSPGSAER